MAMAPHSYSTISAPSPQDTTIGQELRLVTSQKLRLEKEPGLPDREWLLELAHTLQTTLDVERLIELFSAQVNYVLSGIGVEYWGYKGDICASFGESYEHACAYNLVLEESNLGTVTFSRPQPFTQSIRAIIENALCSLVYPLRNSLLHRDALKAATRDPLTGVNNRMSLNTILKREVDLSHRHGNPLSIIMLDADQFKAVNDIHGHLVGDTALKALAGCIKATVRDSDIVFRYGGEEFLIVLSSTDIAGASLLAERLRSAVQDLTIQSEEICIKITVSLGVANLKEEDDSIRLLQRADRALYEAKSTGRNGVTSSAGHESEAIVPNDVRVSPAPSS
ncbi:MAG: GGDEF domain-containing protein [Gammaproteobacteria bacterium]|jgi:diguanylate cyclase (GGDEF)-like protein